MYPETKQLERESNAGSIRRKSNAPLLHHGGELPDALALLAKNVLGAGGADDDLSAERRHAHLHTGVSLLRKLLGKKLDPPTEYNRVVGAKSGERSLRVLCGLCRCFRITPYKKRWISWRIGLLRQRGK